MKPEEAKNSIAESIKNFNKNDLTFNALSLFNTLGYNTERQSPLDKPSYQSFKNYFIPADSKFNEAKALVNDWNYVDLLFQLTKDEVLKQTSLFDTKQVITKGETQSVIETYLFFAIELKGNSYTRGELAEITREVNKLFPMPVMILFKYNNFLTLSIINRRLHKRDNSKDVLEKVTLIKDIKIPSSNEEENNHNVTHRAHIEILYDLSFAKLYDQYQFKNFVDLHNAWQKTLDIKELNAKFFKELSNWYFWAVDKTVWPDDSEQLKKKDVRNATNVIRLITRLIFVWFLKEKNLVPYKLFVKKEVEKLLKFSDSNKSSYYKAILQNLFFATLNTEMGKRKFKIQSSSSRNPQYFVPSVFRYKNEFLNPDETLKQYFDPIPFLNGGLFECLDDINGTVRIDGFSDRKENVIKVPDELFFLEKEEEVDLNKIYGTKNKRYKVRGLLEILNSYKFTITENTPIEEEVALDPELLGKVFENLLASYNPETQTTARKQTGSFYTPREIVNYMVEESIIACLKTKMMEGASSFVQVGLDQTDMFGNKARTGQLKIEEELTPNRWTDKETELENELRKLISYSEEKHTFTTQETELLIEAIDNCKILDPACGSGAFPMGVLHKLVHILHKLDPNNDKWKELQRKKAVAETEEVFHIDANCEREALLKEINETFDTNINYPDYGRKIYLIENCLFGVDIQPIAVQIAKLRFFISLLIEQKVDWTKPDKNYNIKPLPNLETKIVAANTLIGIEKPEGLDLRNKQVREKEKELSIIRHKHFNARNYKRKDELRKEDEQLRKQIGEIIKKEYEHFCAGITEDIKREQIKINSGKKSIKELEKSGKSESFIKEQKEKYSKSIKASEKLIEKLNSEMESNSSIETTANKIANWNPYNHNTFAEFFDPEWMFGLTKGFDIVIGNPPYVRADNPAISEMRQQIMESKQYFTLYEKWDLMVAFYEKSLSILKNNGVHTFIASNSITTSKFSYKLQDWILDKFKIKSIDYFEDDMQIFEAGVVPVITVIQRTDLDILPHKIYRSNDFLNINRTVDVDKNILTNLRERIFKKSFDSIFYPYINSNLLGDICYISYGLRPNSDERFWKGEFSKEDLISEIKDKTHSKPYIEGKYLKKYLIEKIKYLEWNTDRSPKKLVRPTFPALYEDEKIFRGRVTEGTFDNTGILCNDSIVVFKRFIDLRNINERSISVSISKNNFANKIGKTSLQVAKRRNELEKISENYFLKYLLAVINSKYALAYLNNFRKHRLINYFYPDDFRNYPIPIISQLDQFSFSNLVDYILLLKRINKDSVFFECLIDSLVYELYFPEEIKAAGCEVLKHLTDLPELKEDWSDEKKLKTIDKVYKELSAPNHPVSIAMFKMDTVEEVRIIEGKQ